MRKKILVIFGTRPEAIKLFPLIFELRRRRGIVCRVCVSAQHRELLDAVLSRFGIRPDIDLNIMKEDQTPLGVTSTLLELLDRVIESERPDRVVVHGDTSTALAAALAAFFHRVPVAHVEAGLRSGDMYSPFPEEFNRRAISLVADIHLAPTADAAKNLVREGIDRGIFVTGNTAIDALQYTLREDYSHPLLDACTGKRIILLTCHRRENIGEGMLSIFAAIRRICKARDDIRVIYPVHPNPTVRRIAAKAFEGCRGILLTEPLATEDFHNILSLSYLVASDSGGVQEEASAMHVPTVILRDTTERTEGISAGSLVLAGTKTQDIIEHITALLDDTALYNRMKASPCPFGDGHASKRIADIIEASS